MIHPPAFRSLERFTQAEFTSWLDGLPPDDLHHYELLEGFIVREPPAGWPHSSVAVEILVRLAVHVREHRLGMVFESSQGFDLATGDTVEPDVAFVSNARWQTVPRPIRGFLRVAPELVFEVLSPSTQRIDTTSKKRVYARNRVTEYVLVDAPTRSLEHFVLDGEHYGTGQRLAARDTFQSQVLPGFEIRVGRIFPDA